MTEHIGRFIVEQPLQRGESYLVDRETDTRWALGDWSKYDLFDATLWALNRLAEELKANPRKEGGHD